MSPEVVSASAYDVVNDYEHLRAVELVDAEFKLKDVIKNSEFDDKVKSNMDWARRKQEALYAHFASC